MRLQRGDPVRGERRAEDVAHPPVVRRVEGDELAGAVGVVGRVDVVAHAVDEPLVVGEARGDVLVPGEHPQVAPRVVVDRGTFPQLPVQLVRVVERGVGQRVVGDRCRPVAAPAAELRGSRSGQRNCSLLRTSAGVTKRFSQT